MSLPQPIPARNLLPNRRAAETFSLEHRGTDFTITAGCYAGGRIGEIFISAGRPNSALDAIIRHALKRDGRGIAASPIGAALDLIEASE